jgi:uncharacterized repeat protein (TIGR03803 family)
MQRTVSLRQLARPLVTGLLVLIGAAGATAADTFNLTTRQLTMPSVVIGGATYSNMTVTVGALISGPSGTSANGNQDSYDPGTNRLTVQSVTANSITYYNAVVNVAGLVSIGAVTGANTYNGTSLIIPYVQVGAAIYQNAVVSVGSVLSVAGGMPTFVTNTYDPSTKHLAIPAVIDQVSNLVYTNVIITVGGVSSVGGVSATAQETIVHSFTGAGGITGSNDGAVPTGLILGNSGTLYGVTYPGGANARGVIFMIPRGGSETVLYSFTGNGGVAASTDGAAPSSLLLGSDGNLYGTTESGGASNEGTVFEYTSGGVESVIYSFTGHGGVPSSTDGAMPVGLIQGSDGSFYGTTLLGGANDGGTAFNVASGVETVIYSFGGGPTGASSSSDGIAPLGALLQVDGIFYGTTQMGGTDKAGTVFSLTSLGVEAVNYSFTGGSHGSGGNPDGAFPDAGLVLGNDGNYYGTTFYAGADGAGTVFSMTPTGLETVIHAFSGAGHVTGSTDGAYPSAGLLLGRDGNLYGTTRDGGPQFYGGTIFKITKSGVETVLYSFTGLNEGSSDGATPTLGLISDSQGNIYGTTAGGGAFGKGVVFEVTGAIAAQ